MTLQEIADRINALFRRYGLDHDVVTVAYHERPYGVVHMYPTRQPHQHHLDPRENEPDPMQWRSSQSDYIRNVYEEIVIIDADDAGKMSLLLPTLDYIFDTFFSVHPESDQLRLF